MAIGLRSLIRARVWLAEHLLLDHRHALLVAAAAIGALGAVTTWAFTHAIVAVQRLFAISGDPQVVAAALPGWRILLTPAIGGVLAGAVLLLGQRLARGQSSTDYMEALVLGDGAIPTRTTLVKSASSLVTIASGGSIGREGSLVQLSAWLSAQMARLFRMPASRRRLLVACGASAGIAAAYNAPLAGAIFVSEIVMRTIAVETLGPLLLASVTASALSRQLLQAEPVFGQPGFTLSSPWELLPYAGLGVIAGFSAPLYLTVLDGARRVFARVALPAPAALALGGLLVGALALAEPRVWGNGAGVIGDLLREPWTAGTLAVLLVGKLVATAATSGSGAVGGVFTPTLLIGAALGGLAGSAAHALWPQTVVASAPYALVG
ncbi:MAG: chloride channel protein, partial [Planctomycetes bacterium]|nr:chloride channel protein [Planctomycetota bacterium]